MRETLGTINKFIDKLLFKIYLIHVYMHLVCLQFLKSRACPAVTETNSKIFWLRHYKHCTRNYDLPILCTQMHFICDVDFTGNPQYICNVVCFGEIFPLENRFGLKYKQAAEGNTKQNSIKVSMYTTYT